MVIKMIKIIKKNIVSDIDFWDYIKEVPSPCYVYNTDILENICDFIVENINYFTNIYFYYAMKSNNNMNILKTVKRYVNGIDVATIEEYSLAKKAGFTSISCNGPSFTIDDIRNIYNEGHIIDFDNYNQLFQVEDIVKNKKIGLRLKVGKSRFGLDLENEELQNFILRNNISVTRIHFHYGEKSVDNFMTLKNIAEEIKSIDYLNYVSTINIGGGFDKILLKNHFREFLDKVSKIFNGYKVIIEPGKGVVDYCGFLITKVISSNYINNINDVTVNTSAHNVLTWFMPRPIFTNSETNIKIKTNIYGNSCYEEDKFAINLEYPFVDTGNLIVFFPVGAYGSVNNKNLHNQSNLNEYIYSSRGKMFYEK